MRQWAWKLVGGREHLRERYSALAKQIFAPKTSRIKAFISECVGQPRRQQQDADSCGHAARVRFVS